MPNINIARDAHDQNFKALMSEPDFFNCFFKTYLPRNLQRAIDLKTAEISTRPLKHLEPKTNKTFEADLVYLLKNKKINNKINSTDQDTLVFVHIEHQSTPDKNMPLRIAHYQTAQVLSYIKEKGQKENIEINKPPKIISFIYYQGDRPWPYPINFKYVSPGVMLLIDLPLTSDEILLRHKGIGQIEVLLKYIGLKNHKNKLEKLLPGLQTCNNIIREILLKYLVAVTEFSEEEFIKIIERCLPQEKGITMTLAERWYQDGRVEGIETGIEKGIQQGIEEGQKRVALKMLMDGMNERIVARLTDLSFKTVAQLKKAIQH